MEPLKVLFSMCRSSRYGFRPSEPSPAVPVHQPPASAQGGVVDDSGNGKPVTSPESLHIPQPDKELLYVMGEKMLGAARASGQALSLVVVQVYDLPEVELVFGRLAAGQVVHEVMSELTRVADRKGLVVRSEPDIFALLMPAMSAEAAVGALGGRFGKPCVIEFELDGNEILLVPDIRVHTFEPTERVAQVYHRLCRALTKSREQQEPRCELVSNEPGMRTIPMGLPATVTAQAWRADAFLVLPPTIPVPMGAH